MVIVMQEGASDAQIQNVIDKLVVHGFDVHRSTGASHTVLGAVGVHRDFDHRDFELLQGVREVVRITQPFKLASRAFKPRTSPYAFQGMGEKGLQLMREAADKFGLFVVSEVMDASQIPMMGTYVD